MRVDAHQHYWQVERGDYGWLTPQTGILYRDYMPGDLRGLLQESGMHKTIVVQAAPTIEETEFLLGLCEQEPTLAGVVGWLDLESDNFERDFLRLRENRFFVGVRPMLQDLEDDAYIIRPKVISAIKLLIEHQFPIDLLVMPRHLPHVITLLEKLPDLKAVIDHIAKPNIADGILMPWSNHMREIAANPNIFCKLSGMVTEARHNEWKRDEFIPYVQHVVEIFGTGRIMYGSDWPVCLLSAQYSEVVELLNDILPSGMTEEEKEKLFGRNAIEFYRLQLD